MNYYSEDYLAHFGIKGQKWGIRRFQNLDGTLTEAGKKHYGLTAQEFKNQAEQDIAKAKFAKKVQKEANKLRNRIEKADRQYQMEKTIEYDQKAKNAKRVGKAALAVALPAAGVSALTNMTAQKTIMDNLAIGNEEGRLDSSALRFLRENGGNGWQTQDALKRAEDIADWKMRTTAKLAGAMPSASEAAAVNPIATGVAVASGTVAAVAFGKAAYDRVVSTAAKRRISDVGHGKAVERMNKQYNKVVNMVKDTPYKSLLDARVEAYKQEHPGTELSDKQIMKNLM